MKKRTIRTIILVVLLASIMLGAGCVGTSNPVKSTADVSNVVTNISTNVESIGSTLEDIDRGLGGG